MGGKAAYGSPAEPRSHIMLWVIVLNPCELNAVIAALTNYFFTTLSKEDFLCLSIFLRELSKSMITTTVFQELCDKGDKKE